MLQGRLKGSDETPILFRRAKKLISNGKLAVERSTYFHSTDSLESTN
jgi:hypothetical protein